MVFFKDDSTPAFLSKRFDVLSDEKKLKQEDFAQIAQRSEETHGKNYKYDFSYEEISSLMKQFVSAYRIEVEKFFNLVMFNYLNHNGDAHLKNFSLFSDGELHNPYLLTPAYDLLNTRLHLPNESATALSLFKDSYQTESFKHNGFYARDDFFEFGIKIGITENRVNRFIDNIVTHSTEMNELLNRSFLSNELKKQYSDMVSVRIKALSYSFGSSS